MKISYRVKKKKMFVCLFVFLVLLLSKDEGTGFSIPVLQRNLGTVKPFDFYKSVSL